MGGPTRLWENSFWEQSTFHLIIYRARTHPCYPSSVRIGTKPNTVLSRGYSLAGLFALWASYQSTSFHGIASASPSVWFKNWLDYAAQRSPTLQLAYLSLGDREEHTKTEIMSHVGECIRRQYELYRQSRTHCTLEWNKGNHFQDNGERTAKGFVWLLTNSHGRS